MSFNIDNYISNLAYINKDFNSTWEEILEVVPKLTNKWKPSESNESDPLVVLLKELGIVTDKLNYNIDKNTLEAFPDLLTQLRAAYSIFGSMGYTPQWYRSATTNVTFLYNGGLGETSASNIKSADAEWILDRFTSVSNEDNTIEYVTLEPLKFQVGYPQAQQALAIEGTLADLEVNGSKQITLDCLDSQNRIYFLQSNVAQNGIFISKTGDFSDVEIENSYYDADTTDYSPTGGAGIESAWHRVTNLYQQLPGSYVFKFGIDPATGSAYIQFPDDIGNLIGSGIYIRYILSSGESGNIKANTLTEFSSSLSCSAVGNISIEDTSSGSDEESSTSEYVVTQDNVSVSNAAANQNGYDPETIEEMQANYNRVVGTFNTLVTTLDYENYLYKQANEIGQPYVSNIRVSDRNTDLYSSHTVKSLTVQGTFITVKEQVGKGEKAIEKDFEAGLEASDLRFYPVGRGQSAVDKNTFSSTFKEFSQDTTGSLKTILENEVADAKAIIHDYRSFGSPIFLDYQLKGQIYLQTTLSKEEAAEVKENVDSALYRYLEARQLTFGKEVDYGKVVDVIKAADPRIQYVALNPIEYSVDADSLALYNKRSPYDVQQKSILAGTTPWTQFKPFRFYWGTTDIASYPPESSDKYIKSISPIITSVSDIEDESGTPKTATEEFEEISHTVEANETFYILAPGYTTTISYGNYFYMKSTVEIAKDTPIKLGENQYIYIYEERPSTESVKPAYTIGKDTVIRCNVDISDPDKVQDAKYQTNKAINMGSNITLEILGPDEYKLKNTYQSAYQYGIKIATNSQGLLKALKNGSLKTYTLNVGEYLLWTNVLSSNDGDVPITEVGIVGEGNTLTWKSPLEVSEEFKVIGADDTSADDYNGFSWLKVGNEVLSYRTNTLYTFGEGTELTFTLVESGKSVWEDGARGDNTQIFPLTSGVTISYKTSDSGEALELPKILDDEEYLAYIGLSLALSPNKTQKLLANQAVILDQGSGDLTTIEGSKDGIYLQSNAVLVYAGGQPLTLSDAESESLILRKLTGSISDDTEAATFITNNNYTCPKNSILLYASQSDAKEISFQLSVNGGGSAVGAKVGLAYEIESNAEYWTGSEFKKVSALGTEELSTRELGVDQIYHISYCPLYQPSDQELIENPQEASSYFKSNHVCNKYVLPRLTSLEELKISPLSIRS